MISQILKSIDSFLDPLFFFIPVYDGKLKVDPKTGNYIQDNKEIMLKAIIKPIKAVGSPNNLAGYDLNAISFEGWLIDPPRMPSDVDWPLSTRGIWKNKKVAVTLFPAMQKSEYVLKYTGEYINGNLYI